MLEDINIPKEVIHEAAPIPAEDDLEKIGRNSPAEGQYRVRQAQMAAHEARLHQAHFDVLKTREETRQDAEARERAKRLRTIQAASQDLERQIEAGREMLKDLEAQYHERTHPLVCGISPEALRDANRERFGYHAERYANLERELGITSGKPSEADSAGSFMSEMS